MSKLRIAAVSFCGVWSVGLLFAAVIDSSGRMNPYLKADFSAAWHMYWGAIAIASVLVALVASAED